MACPDLSVRVLRGDTRTRLRRFPGVSRCRVEKAHQRGAGLLPVRQWWANSSSDPVFENVEGDQRSHRGGPMIWTPGLAGPGGLVMTIRVVEMFRGFIPVPRVKSRSTSRGEVTVLAGEVNSESSGNAMSIVDLPNARFLHELRNTLDLHMVMSRGEAGRNCVSVNVLYTLRNSNLRRELIRTCRGREGTAKKNWGIGKKKAPPPVPCEPFFGNPLIERGASRVSYGSHYSPAVDRRGWACVRHPN